MADSKICLTLCLALFGASACSDDSEGSGDEGSNTSSSEGTSTTDMSTTGPGGTDETETDTEGMETETGDGDGEDPILEAEDFACILDMPKVRRFYITNVLGDLDATLAIADSPDGGVYPVGTLIQLVPSEAMVKRAPGYAPQANDWEFFSLDVSADGTQILDRGSDEVVNAFGGNCFDCHDKAEPEWDFVCEQDHGCDPLPLTEEQITSVQQADPRCR